MKIIAKKNYLFEVCLYAPQAGGYKIKEGTEWMCLSKLDGQYLLRRCNCACNSDIIQVNEKTFLEIFDLVED